jgi:hypothetical protein
MSFDRSLTTGPPLRLRTNVRLSSRSVGDHRCQLRSWRGSRSPGYRATCLASARPRSATLQYLAASRKVTGEGIARSRSACSLSRRRITLRGCRYGARSSLCAPTAAGAFGTWPMSAMPFSRHVYGVSIAASRHQGGEDDRPPDLRTFVLARSRCPRTCALARTLANVDLDLCDRVTQL